MGLKVKEHLDAMDTPEGRTQQAVKTRFILELRRLARERGWKFNKIFYRHGNLTGRPIAIDPLTSVNKNSKGYP